MSRRVASYIRTLITSRMYSKNAWESEITLPSGTTVKGLESDAVAELYKNNRPELARALAQRFTPEVLDAFAKPLVYKSGKSNFNGPEVGGYVDAAQRLNVIDAFNRCGGDMIVFAEILHQRRALDLLILDQPVQPFPRAVGIRGDDDLADFKLFANSLVGFFAA